MIIPSFFHLFTRERNLHTVLYHCTTSKNLTLIGKYRYTSYSNGVTQPTTSSIIVITMMVMDLQAVGVSPPPTAAVSSDPRDEGIWQMPHGGSEHHPSPSDSSIFSSHCCPASFPPFLLLEPPTHCILTLFRDPHRCPHEPSKQECHDRRRRPSPPQR